MKLKSLMFMLVLLLPGTRLIAQVTTDVLGMHALGPGSSSPISGTMPPACDYCHAPHSGLNIGLWNQKLSAQIYTLYSSTTEKNATKQPVLGYSSSQCLSCHDGSVAAGTTVVYGKVNMSGSMYAKDVFGTNLQLSHPFSLHTPLQDNIDLVSTLATSGKTADPNHKIKLVHGNVECTTCHNPHIQSLDIISQNFLVENSASGTMCLACHDPTRTSTVTGQVNPIADWATSAHAISALKVLPQAQVGSYTTVAATACIGCHTPHNAGGASRILRGFNENDCIACHNGVNITSMPPYANVFAEYATPKVGHPFPTTNSPHDAAEPTLVTNNNRHATCVDCHNGHSSQIVGTFPPPPLIRLSQMDIAGVSSTDGVTAVVPAVNQFENCFRCHATSIGKTTMPIYGYAPVRAVSVSDSLNVNQQFTASSAYSSHPVTHTSNSTLSQPSLLTNMMKLDGITQSRAMGTQILCTDCHNSDDNREFGGNGANGAHGSKWTHILERRYEFSQTLTPGGQINNLYPTPDLSVLGPYGLCGKCHNLTSVVVNGDSWTGHKNHVNADGFTCSTCHTSHGMGTTNTYITGERLINFDVNVVAANGGTPISYTHTNNTCVLVCHQVAHNADGSVSAVSLKKKIGIVPKK